MAIIEDCTPPCAPNVPLPVPGVSDPIGCCPVATGEVVCWSSGEESGRAFASYNPITGEVTYIDTVTGDAVASADIVACPPVTAPVEVVGTVNVALTNDWAQVNGVVSHIVAAAGGATVAGLQSVTFTNVGTTAGSVGGAPIAPGESITYTGYDNPVTRQSVRLPAIAYVASATALLSISTIA